MKKLIPAYVISFVLIFMLCLYEPITMYMLNFHDFWFDLFIIIKPLLLTALVLFVVLALIFTGIYFANEKISSKHNFYNICLIIFFICFVCTYIQGNYMIANLPSLDGRHINWDKYTIQNIASILMWIIVSGVVIFSCIKFKVESVINSIIYISIAIFLMLMSSMVASIRPHSWDTKVLSVSTTKNYNLASTDKNFFIFLLDAVDSRKFDQALIKNKKESIFEDFTYYKDTTSTYGYTRDSIPFILSGKWNRNKTSFEDYYNNALDNSLLFNSLSDKDYNINMYDNDLFWSTNKSKVLSNVVTLNRNINTKDYLKQQTKYVLFKYLPYPLKRFSKIEKLDFNGSKVHNDYELFNWGDKTNYKYIKDNDIEKTDDKVFHFVHIEGAHVPFDLDGKLKKVNGTYNQKIDASITVIEAYLNRLKKANVYDNSVIIIMADHGYGKQVTGRHNPILFIKGIDEHHDMIRSDIKVSYTDLNDCYTDLLDNKKSTELLQDVSESRVRKMIWYRYLKENHMVEYKQTGKAWDKETFVKTGKEYNR